MIIENFNGYLLILLAVISGIIESSRGEGRRLYMSYRRKGYKIISPIVVNNQNVQYLDKSLP